MWQEWIQYRESGEGEAKGEQGRHRALSVAGRTLREMGAPGGSEQRLDGSRQHLQMDWREERSQRVSQPFSEQAREEGLPCMRLEGCRQSGI